MRTFIRRKRKLVLVLLAMLVAVVGPYLASRFLSQNRVVTVRRNQEVPLLDDVSEIRVAAFNIAHGRGATDSNWEEGGPAKRQRVKETAQLLRSLKADIVILNEVDFSAAWSGHQNQAEAIAKSAHFPYWVEQRNLDFRFIYGSWKFGNAVLSKYPIADAQLVDLPRHSVWESWLAGCKRAVVCTIQLAPDRQLRILAVHLESRSEQVRVESARAILQLAKSSDVPLIAAGDFNSTPKGFPESQTTTDGVNAMDVLQQSGAFGRLSGSSAHHDLTYSSMQPSRVIDWILVPAEFSFSDYRAVDTQLSDHRPVIATIKLQD